MKKSLLTLLTVFLLIACGSKGTETSAMDKKMNSLKEWHLVGKVKSIKSSLGTYAEFNEDGNITLLNNDEIKYVSPNKYKIAENEWNIIYSDSTRIDQLSDESPDFQEEKIYIYDKFGRLVRYSETKYNGSYEQIFEYANDTEHLPNKIIGEGGDTEGSYKRITEIKYLKKDENGNYLSRELTHTDIEDIEGESTSETSTETEDYEITYYQ